MDMAVTVSAFRYSCGGRSLEPSPNPWMGPGWDVQQYSSQAMAPLQPFAITWPHSYSGTEIGYWDANRICVGYQLRD